jgi:hypothetical protein
MAFQIRSSARGVEQRRRAVTREENGVAEFPKVTADKFTVNVIVKGYRPSWRGIRPNGSEDPIRMRVEKWASTPK